MAALTSTIPFVYIILCSTIGTFLWLKMSKILKENKYTTNGFLVNIDLASFSHLIKNEKNASNRKKYNQIYFGQIILIPITILGLILIRFLA